LCTYVALQFELQPQALADDMRVCEGNRLLGLQANNTQEMDNGFISLLWICCGREKSLELGELRFRNAIGG